MATRRESVVLDLEDRVTPGLLRVAAAAEVADRALKNMGGSSSTASRGVKDLEAETSKTARSVESGGKSIDKYSGRLGLLVQALTAVGPAAIPIGAVAVPAVTALGGSVVSLGLGAGVTKLAFTGLGDALSKFNKASLSPTATNIAAAQEAMDKLPPSARALVLELHSLTPLLSKLRQDAAGGLMSGVTDGLHSILRDGPLVRTSIRGISGELGQMARATGHALASDQWRPFLAFAGREAPVALHTLGTAAGDVGHGLSQILMAFGPMNRQVDSGILKLAQDFDKWATSLDRTQGFQDFVQYIETNGPHVVSLLGDVGQLFVDIVKAAAPLGGPTLQALDALAKVLDLVANSPLATPLLALAQLYSITKLVSRGYDQIRTASVKAFDSKALAGTKSAVGSLFAVTSAQDRARLSASELAAVERERNVNIAKGAAALGAFALVASGAADKMGLSNTAMLGMAGLMVGPWGAAVGGAVGFTMDLAHAQDDLTNSAKAATRAFASQGSSIDLGTQSKALSDLQANIASADQARSDFFNSTGDSAHLFGALKEGTSIVSDFFTHAREEAKQTADELAVDNANIQTAFGALFSGMGGSDKNAFGASQLLSVQQLQQVATRAQPAMEALGITVDDLQAAAARGDGSLGHLVSRIVAFTNRAESTKGQSKAVADAFASMSNEALTADQRVQGLTDALDGLIDPMLNLGQAHDAFRKGLNDIEQSLSKNSKSLKGNSDAAIQNRDAIRTQVTNLKAWIEAQAQAGVAPQKMTAALKQGRQAIIDEGHAAGLNKAQIAAMIDQMGLTPKEIKTTIALLGAQQADNLVNGLRTQLEGLDGRVFHATINVTRTGTSDLTATGGHVMRADGGSIPGPRHPYGDKVFAMLAPGEEVISNRYGQADRFRADRAAGRIPAYADGGTVLTGVGSSGAGTGGHHLSPLELSIRRFTHLLDLASQSLDKERQRRDNLVQAEQQLASSVATSLRSDIFGQTTQASTSIWSAGAHAATVISPQSILRGDIRDARGFNRALHQLSRKGVHGAALTAIAESGDLQAAQMLAGEDRGQLRQYEHLYNLRNRVTNRTGQYAAVQRYGDKLDDVRDEIRKERDEVRRLRGDVKHLTAEQKKIAKEHAKAVAAGINKPGQTAARRRRT